MLGAQQPLHPHLWGEWSWEDRGLQEDPPVLRSDLPDDRVTPNSPRQTAALHPSPGGERPQGPPEGTPKKPPKKSGPLPRHSSKSSHVTTEERVLTGIVTSQPYELGRLGSDPTDLCEGLGLKSPSPQTLSTLDSPEVLGVQWNERQKHMGLANMGNT